MSKCVPGEVDYRGHCMPGYLTRGEMEARYQLIQQKEKQAKSSKNKVLVIIGITLALSAGLFVMHFT